jgi:hypothetical protein
VRDRGRPFQSGFSHIGLPHLNGVSTIGRAIGRSGAHVVTIKHLSDSIIQKIDASSSSFWAAQHDADKSRTGLGMMDRQRLKMWLRDAYQQIDTAPV